MLDAARNAKQDRASSSNELPSIATPIPHVFLQMLPDEYDDEGCGYGFEDDDGSSCDLNAEYGDYSFLDRESGASSE